MGYYVKDLTPITFTTSTSNVLVPAELGDLEGLTIFANASSGVFTVQIAPTSDGTFADLQSAGADVTITAPNALVISPVPFRALRLAATYTTSSAVSFPVQGTVVL